MSISPAKYFEGDRVVLTCKEKRNQCNPGTRLYGWYRENHNGEIRGIRVILDGKNRITHTIASVSAGDAGKYRCRCGQSRMSLMSGMSAPFTLDVNKRGQF